MERAELISLLADEAPAQRACRAALEGGAIFHVQPGDGIPANELAPSYRVREAHIRKVGIPSVGFAEAVETLAALEERPVLVGSVAQEASPRSFVVFLAADATAVLACIGVG
ncbi:hypothetical protein AB0J82_14330 [Asanoa sp. NPDC049518]|uniref:hypothetical protein n=1 Tax=unclassified Asanoa TaxID=2685164 RepID=UPI003433007D